MPNQVEGLWFSNDHLVALLAGESIFRVPKSILAARSSVFQAMFEFPQPAPSDGEEIVDGSPAIRLQDASTEVEPFLRAIFDSSYFMPPPSMIGFREVLGILRLSHKYDVGYLHKRALRHFETVYHVRLNEVGSFNEDAHVEYEDDDMYLDLEAIPVLHEVGATWLLPYAYYNLAGTPAIDLFSPGGGWDQFPAGMNQACIRAQARQIQASHLIADAMTPISSCATPDLCNLAKLKFMKRHHITDMVLTPLYDQQYLFGSLYYGVCRDCSAEAEALYRQVRDAVWNKLPANCGLEGWEVLLEKRRIALEL
ncbi:hypothetical protein DFH06DRAFT_1052251 [Mycena polygramma]|nr:hypothetical protein DFH06DRAFT_1052251 [Mycena polygramma]